MALMLWELHGVIGWERTVGHAGVLLSEVGSVVFKIDVQGYADVEITIDVMHGQQRFNSAPISITCKTDELDWTRHITINVYCQLSLVIYI